MKALKIEGLRFCKVRHGTKKPFESDWVNKPYTFEEIYPHILKENNYGVLCGYGGLIVVDSDTPELNEAVAKFLPPTFRVRTGGGGTHDYFICPEAKKKIVLTRDKHYGEVQSYGQQVIGAGSIHPNGKTYEIERDLPIAAITYPELTTAIKPFMKEVQVIENKTLQEMKDYGDADIRNIPIMSVILGNFKLGSKGEYYGENPWHGSSTGMNFWINPSKNVAHCFRCNAGINIAKAIALNEKIISSCGDSLGKEGFIQVLKIAQEKYGLKKPSTKIEEASQVFTQLGQAKAFGKTQPYFYDRTGMFWLWEPDKLCWYVIDDVDILNTINKATGENIIESKRRTELINSLKQEGRKNIPLPIKPTWIQFKNKIYDIENGESFEASPKYFVTNPIDWEISGNPDTPVMDKLFKEWVGDDYSKTLYQIIAYSLLPDYPIHRLFCFVGAGMNGKSCYLNLLKKFIGNRNVTSTELDTLLTSRFEVTKLHKKLVAILGETNFNEMEKTSVLKRLTGGDTIGFEYKNKNPFDELNYAKIIMATNNLPTTSDKTLGFYRRWLIIDWTNKFTEARNVLLDIPEEEYNNLATKSLVLLNELITKREFHNEGTIEERQKRYEDRSDPIEKFMKETTIEEPDGDIPVWEFEKKLNEWCKEHKFRQMTSTSIGKKMKEHGMTQMQIFKDWYENNEATKKRFRCWVGIRWKE